jgi:multidrug efflux pump subunit AcrB
MIMDRITRFSLKNGTAIVLAVLLITAGGIWSAGQLKKESMPDITIPYVIVVTPYPGAAPTDVYDQVTDPLESSMRGIDGLKRVHGQSGDSFSMVIAEFGFSADMEKAERDVAKIVDGVRLPENAMEPSISRIGFNSAPIIRLAITGDEERAEALRADVRDRIVPALSGIEGVGEARLAVDAPSSIRIELDPEALKDEGLTAESVIQQLQAANLSFPIGALDLGTTTEPIRVGGTLSSVEDIEAFQIAVYPDQNKLMGDAFARIGEGMGALGNAVGGLAQGMTQGFSAVGEGMGQLGQGMGQLGEATGQIGEATGQIGMQVGLVNGIQQVQGQLVDTKLALDKLKAAASQMPTGTPEAEQINTQIQVLETQAIPGMEAAIASMQQQIAASQKQLAEQAERMQGAPVATSGGQGPTSGGTTGRRPSAPSGGGLSAGGAEEPELEIGVVRLGDIATVTYGPADGAVGSRANGKPAALIDIVKTQDGNTVDVSKAVRAEMERLAASLPSGSEYVVAYDAATSIEVSIAGMMREGMLGAVFAVIVILLFLRNTRATVIAAVSIPLSVLTAMLLLRQTGVTLNVMTLGGLTVAIGRVVDDSIVVIENIFAHMQRGDELTPDLVRAATAEVSGAITSSTLTTVAVFIPLGMVTGIIGKIFQPFAITVAVALLASLLVAVTVAPLMARWMLLKGKIPVLDRETKMTTGYRSLLDLALRNRAAVIVGATTLFVASLALIPVIGTGFVPETAEKYLNIRVAHPLGTKPTTVDETVRAIEAALDTEADVEHYQSTVGGSVGVDMAGESGGSNNALTLVKLDPEANTDGVLQSLREKTESLAGNGVELVYERIDASGSNSSLDIIVTGPDFEAIREGSEIVEQRLSKVSGLENVASNLGESRAQLAVDVDQGKAAEYGLNAAMVAGAVRSYVAEEKAGTIKIDGQATDITYALKLDQIEETEELAKLKLNTPLGETVRLSDIAKVESAGTPVAVLTRDGEQYAAVSGRITERDSGSVISAVNSALANIELPEGVAYEVSGAAEQMNESFSQLGMAMIIAVAAVFFVMVIAFGEATAPLAILFSLPLAVVGGLLGLLIAGLPLDIPAMIGALMLIGIVVANAIVLIDRVQQRLADGLPRREALLDAGATRIRPILMTALSTIMALLPLAVGWADGALSSASRWRSSSSAG